MQLITKESIAKLYLTTFGRPLDSKGLEYWLNIGDFSDGKGTNFKYIEDVSESFAKQPEYLDAYPEGTSDKEFIFSIYNNLFQREPDKDGLKYWLDELSSGKISRDLAILVIINGAKDDDLSLISNRTELSLYLAETYDFTPNLAKSDTIIKSIMNVTSDIKSINKQKIIDDNFIKEASIDTHSTVNHELDLDNLANSSTTGVSSLDSGVHWKEKEVTFSFNHSIPESYNSYGTKDELTQNWSELNKEQTDTVISIIDEIGNIIDIKLVQVKDNGDIRFNIIDMSSDSTAGFAFYPSTSPDYGGDVFLSQGFNNSPKEFELDKGEQGWATITHELGHALGLKHPFEGDTTLPKNEDNTIHTIMSYTHIEDYVPKVIVMSDTVKLEYNVLYPQLYSLYDISALQSIYGVNNSYHTEDNIYTTKYTDYKIQTIWDAGGEDTIDLSDTKGKSIIDLHEGTINSADSYSLDDIITLHQEGIKDKYINDWISDNITSLYNDNSLYMGHNNLSIANGVIIENIKTGSGDDSITDNQVDNKIYTGDGDDKIYIGSGGLDYIDGGDGEDILYLDLLKDDVTLDKINSKEFTIYNSDFKSIFTNIETIHFKDSIYSIDLLIG